MRTLSFILFLLTFCCSAYAQSEPYKFQEGDVLDISVWQDPKLNRQVVVAPDGYISFPLAGRIRAGGSSSDRVEAALRRSLQKRYTSELEVTVALVGKSKEQESAKDERLIYVTGEVQKPGAFDIQTQTTVLQAIALSGGLSPYAAKKRIQIRRVVNGQEIVQSFNYRDAEQGKNLAGNMLLEPGDVVVVPEKGIFE